MAEEKPKNLDDVKNEEAKIISEENKALKEDIEKLKKDNEALYNALIDKIKKTPSESEEPNEDEEIKKGITEEDIKKCYEEASKEIAERIKEKW